ncbi:MAG: response regulator transcription factor [SAR202 cluster bacterium]|jgi:two-component system response regulator NreC|nr:response regulator transcription factor [SAR202 cluster bacterium]MQG57128.1 response regulator transcription factor [SAR202 cluster bacterium]MQG68974.1 response regulator transcription factor [SAR202 cluster bacterium]|tara:strand:+ start:1948 stop:2637 length:690 start_codon:yes stop_codon:yes gene_type:complete
MTQDEASSEAWVRILIVDDHALFRQGLRALLETEGMAQVVGEATDGNEAVAKARELGPDVVIMDIGMPGMNGLEASRIITQQSPETKVIILTVYDSDNYFFEALDSGASGYVLKQAAFTDLQMALDAVRRDGVFLYPSLARRLVQDYVDRMGSGEERTAYLTLSPREGEVLELIADGRTSREIADLLTISVNTVQTHRSHIMEKLNLHSRAELMRYAVRMGLVRQSGRL